MGKNQVYRNQQHRSHTRYDFGSELLTNDGTNFWHWLVNSDGFVSELRKNGYYQVSRDEIAGQYNQQSLKNKSIQQRIPSFFIDRFESIPTILAKNDLFVVPTGRYGCVIFDRRVFADAYIHLNKHRSSVPVTKLQIRNKARPADAPERAINASHRPAIKTTLLNNPFSTLGSSSWNEQSFIRFLHYCGAFKEVVRNVCRNKSGKYVLGPAGHTKISFPFWMKDSNGHLAQFAFNGISDLDECLFVRDSNTVFVIEAKLNAHVYDLAWYKLAFPSYRFIANRFPWSPTSAENEIKIIPLYAASDSLDSTRAHLYVFPELQIHRRKVDYVSEPSNGIILNDERQFTPKKIYEIDLGK